MPKFREITGQFVGYIPDSPDSDITPDRAPMDGKITFTPIFTGGVIAFPGLVPPEFAHPKPITAYIHDGFVRVDVTAGTGEDAVVTEQPLSLMVTVDDEASQVWSWRADFDEILIGASDEYVQIPSWSFRVPDGAGPVDLTELVPLKTSGSVDVTKGPRGAGLENITAVDGQLVFAYTDGEETTVPVPEAVQGPQGVPGPAGADGAEGPQGEQGPPGEIPDLLVGNITDATPTGKNLMLAATEGAARNALGLQAGATAINGSLSELENGTQTNSRVWSPRNIADYVGGKISPLQSELSSLDLTKTDLSYVEPVARIPFRQHPGSSDKWMQGFNLNPAEGHWYIGMQSATEYIISRVRIADGVLVDQKSFAIESGSYTESLPFWRDSAGRLCFMVRTRGGSVGERTYNVFNYDTGTVGTDITIEGIWRAGQFSNALVTSDARAKSFGVFYVYDWESIKAETPVLLDKVYPLDSGEPTGKNQGLQALADSIVVQQAEVYADPTIIQYANTGASKSTTAWALKDFGDFINDHFPGQISDTGNFKCEGEGLAEAGGVLYSAWTINEGAAASVVILAHGTRNSSKLQPTRSPQLSTYEWSGTFGTSGDIHLVKTGRVVYGLIDGSVGPVASGENKAFVQIPDALRPLNPQRLFVSTASTVGNYSPPVLYVGPKSSGWLTIENRGTGTIGTINRAGFTYDLFI